MAFVMLMKTLLTVQMIATTISVTQTHLENAAIKSMPELAQLIAFSIHSVSMVSAISTKIPSFVLLIVTCHFVLIASAVWLRIMSFVPLTAPLNPATTPFVTSMKILLVAQSAALKIVEIKHPKFAQLKNIVRFAAKIVPQLLQDAVMVFVT